MNFSSPITAAILNNINGGTISNVPKEVRCEVCNILLSSYIVLRDHIAGRKHKNQFKFLCRKKKNKLDLNCVMCNYLCKDNIDWEVHVTSESHVEKAKIYKPQPSVEIPPPITVDHNVNIHQVQSAQPTATSNIPPPLIPFNEMQELQLKMQDKLNEQALRQILAKDRKEWNCINCSVTCQSIQSWEAHLISKKHRKNKHKFHTYPGISKEFVKRKYQNSFVRANETVGNEFIEDGMVFYCKRCDVRMETKLQLEIHMSSNQHKLNHPITPVPVANHFSTSSEPYTAVEQNPQLFNFDNSSYGYGFRNWSAENYMFNKAYVPPNQAELQRQTEMDRQKQLVEEAKSKLLARFPFYAINLQKPAENEPMPVPPPIMDMIPMPPE
ncbi:unnamed protein product [Chironomus riparius]|uniref:C2H2-type domain-containing protein n=1 Tax=Chironomus riparius TaxID=315576 RepID=A0A9N9WU40_9DIPT|nr:unnamed protein product [Chironomus riparius]